MVQDLQEKLKSTVEQSLTQALTPGAAIAIRMNGQAFFETGLGYQDVTHQAPLSADANVYIYSITKSLIATAALHWVDSGLLKLDTPVKVYLTDFPWHSSITLRHLLSHTSGLPDYGGAPAYSEAVKAHPGSPWSTAAFLDFAQAQGIKFSPGAGWAYSNRDKPDYGVALVYQIADMIAAHYADKPTILSSSISVI